MGGGDPGAMKPVGAVVLAAGASRRLGQPKQLVHFQGTTLVRRAVLSALEAGCSPVMVVSGAEPGVADELEGLDEARLVPHALWQAGIGGSIRAGIGALEKEDAATRGAVLMVCDQPLVDAGVVSSLLEVQWMSGHTAVATRYGRILGVPAFFGRSWFPCLKRLPFRKGANAIIARHRAQVAEMPFPAAAWDIDTEADLARLRTLEQAREPAAV
jgi:molybdenum cofactor cytidylyltransferase